MLYVISQLIDYDYIIGDINSDSTVDILDIVLIVNIILDTLEPDELQILASDLNQDNMINILDVVQIVNIILD